MQGASSRPCSEAFSISCHHRCGSTRSEVRGGARILINLFSGIFSSLDWIFSSVHALPSKEQSVGVAAGPPKSLLEVQPRLCVLGGDGGRVVPLSPPGSGPVGLRRPLRRCRAVPGWRGRSVSAPHGSARPMLPWGLLGAGGALARARGGACGHPAAPRGPAGGLGGSRCPPGALCSQGSAVPCRAMPCRAVPPPAGSLRRAPRSRPRV